MKKMIFLVSGEWGTLKFIHKVIDIYSLNIKISCVIADRECGALDYANNNSIENYIIDLSIINQWSSLKTKFDSYKPDLIITTFHKIIPKFILESFPNKFLNLHYSLLPSFKGLIGMKTVEEAKRINASFIGATAHIIDENVDEGLIVSQFCMKVDWNKNLLPIYDEVFRGGCLTIFNAILIIFQINLESKADFRATFSYNPDLKFDSQKINTNFWNKLDDCIQ